MEAPPPRNGDRVSDSGYVLIDCLAPPFSFFFALCALHLEPRSNAQEEEQEWDKVASGCFA